MQGNCRSYSEKLCTKNDTFELVFSIIVFKITKTKVFRKQLCFLVKITVKIREFTMITMTITNALHNFR